MDPDPDPGIRGKVDPDPRIHLSVILDPDPRFHIWKKWIRIRIRIRVPIFHIFIKKFMPDKLQCLFLLPPNFRKGISQITKTCKHLVLLVTLHSFGATRIQINAFLSGSGSGRGKKSKWIPKRRLKWIRNQPVDPDPKRWL